MLDGLRGQTMPAVDHLSLSTTPIMLFDGQSPVSQGTGFYFARKKKDENILFLVTNYHVLTGSAPSEGKPPIGDRISFQFHRDADNPSDVKTINLPLFGNTGRPLWISSTDFPDADMSVIPLPTPTYDGCAVHGISAEWATSGSLKVRPTSNVTLIGYPYGYYDTTNALPIWKTGNVASEPDIDFDGKPLIVVDISAFPGMSGAPAFAFAYGTYESTEGPTKVGSARRFLGVYASMQMLKERRYLEEFPQASSVGIETEESLELGHIWKAKLIIETIDAMNVEDYVKEVYKQIE